MHYPMPAIVARPTLMLQWPDDCGVAENLGA
jgi:hypothetical protein